MHQRDDLLGRLLFVRRRHRCAGDAELDPGVKLLRFTAALVKPERQVAGHVRRAVVVFQLLHLGAVPFSLRAVAGRADFEINDTATMDRLRRAGRNRRYLELRRGLALARRQLSKPFIVHVVVILERPGGKAVKDTLPGQSADVIHHGPALRVGQMLKARHRGAGYPATDHPHQIRIVRHAVERRRELEFLPAERPRRRIKQGAAPTVAVQTMTVRTMLAEEHRTVLLG